MSIARHARWMVFPAMLACTPAVTAAAPLAGIRFDHNDWTIACDNTRTCRAAGYQAEDGSSDPVSVLLTRKGGPDQPVTAELMIGDYDQPATPSILRLRIDGQALGRLPEASGGALTPAQTAALLKALTRDSEILVIGNDGHQWKLSDHGASAVFLKMDEFQGRLGTPGALMRKGKRAESSVTPALPPPRITRVAWPTTRPADEALGAQPALRTALRQSVDSDSCDVLVDAEQKEPINVQRLSADKLLASTPCWMGAYNVGVGFWVINETEPYAPVLVTTGASEGGDGMISAAQKGRGLGDCWATESWVWDGRQFVHSAESTSGMCRLVTAGGPWDLPTLVTEVR